MLGLRLPLEIACLVVKLASRCNMDCGYCYIYHGKDQSWRGMPKVMSQQTVAKLVAVVKSLYATQTVPPQVVFHGGEPLLFGVRRFVSLLDTIVREVPDANLSVQTNGTIYNRELESALLKYRGNLSFSLSVDGFKAENDRHRVGLHGESKFNVIERTVGRARDLGILDNVLMVVDVENSPASVYSFMTWANARSYNLLLQDGDHLRLPTGKASTTSSEAGEWLVDLYGRYVSDCPPFRIKLFDDVSASIVSLHRGLRRAASRRTACTMTIDTNGEIKQVDTLRINPDQADVLDGSTIHDTEIRDALYSPGNVRRLEVEADLSDECRSCRFVGACGGGYIQHRLNENGYRNPSVFCRDYLYLYEAIEAILCR